jgi:hypothetical protein
MHRLQETLIDFLLRDAIALGLHLNQVALKLAARWPRHHSGYGDASTRDTLQAPVFGLISRGPRLAAFECQQPTKKATFKRPIQRLDQRP